MAHGWQFQHGATVVSSGKHADIAINNLCCISSNIYNAADLPPFTGTCLGSASGKYHYATQDKPPLSCTTLVQNYYQTSQL